MLIIKNMAPPEEWGPPAWAFIFAIIDEMEEYPINTDYYTMFFESLKGTLPCSECRMHYTRYCELNPPPVWSRTALKKWAMDLRMSIRKRKNKKWWQI